MIWFDQLFLEFIWKIILVIEFNVIEFNYII